jgi:hypothetical protein
MVIEFAINQTVSGNGVTSMYPTRLELIARSESGKEERWMQAAGSKSAKNRENGTFANEHILRHNP